MCVKVNDGNREEIIINVNRRTNRGTVVRESIENCSLCTAAAICNIGGKFKMTSGDVIKEFGWKHQTKYSMSNWAGDISKRTEMEQVFTGITNDVLIRLPETTQNIQKQAEGIYRFCCKKLSYCSSTIFGSVKDMKSFKDSTSWMLDQKAETIFAVFFISTVAMKDASHWLVAIRTNHGIQYRDYQTDFVSDSNSGPTVSDKLVMGINNYVYQGEDMQYVRMIVVAFQPWLKGSMRPN